MLRWLVVVLTLALVLGAAQGPVWAQAAPSSEDSVNDADGDGDVDGEILVKFKPGTSEAKKKQVIANKGDREKEEKRIPKPKLIDIRVIGVNGDEENKAKDYEKDPNVQYAEPNFIYHPSATTANDTNFANLYGLNNTGQTVNNVAGTADADIDAPEAWDETSGGTTGLSDTVVAIIDTGVDISHPELDYGVWTNPNEVADGVDNDGNGYKDDLNGWDFYHNDASVYDASDGDDHGTHVAGTIAARGNNNAGVVGVNWQAKIMPLKFLGPNGGSTDDAIKALDYAVSKGAKISNNSWGGGGFSQALQDALGRADEAGHLFVAAAGNSGANNDSSAHYPSSYNNPNVVSVAATDSKDTLASFSNYGATSVDLAAPGVNIYSTLPGNSYGYKSGTSMATPHVTGAAALIRSKYPTLDAAGVKAKLLDSVDKKGNLSGKMSAGGRLNAAGALGTTTITSGPSGTVASTSATFEFSSSENGATFQCSLDDGAFSSCTSGTSYTVPDGSHTFRVQAVNAAGSILDPIPASRTWTSDTTAPTVVSNSVTPASGATGVNRRTTVTAKFSEAVTQGTVKPTTFYLTKDGATTSTSATVTYDPATRTATLKPSARLDANATYKATVDGVTDPAGNRNNPYSWTFTTGK